MKKMYEKNLYTMRQYCSSGNRFFEKKVKHFSLNVVFGIMEVIIIAAINSMTFY